MTETNAGHRIRRIAAEIEQGCAALDLEDLAALLADLDTAATKLREAIKSVKYAARAAMDAAGVDRYEGDSLPAPLVATTEGAYPRWDGRATARRVAAQCADEVVHPETGEIPPLGVIVQHVADAIVDCAGLTPSKQWRKTSLHDRNISLAELVTTPEGTPSVTWWRKP